MDHRIGRRFISSNPLQDSGTGVKRRFSFKVEDLIADNSGSFQQQKCSLKSDECPVSTFQQPCDLSNHIDSAHPRKDSKGHEEGDIARRKKSRSSFSVEQLYELEKRFSTQRYLGTKERAEFANKIKLNNTQVKTWFQNRRMKLKRQKVEAANRLAKFSMLRNFGYSAPTMDAIPHTIPTLGYDGSQNLAQPFPLSLPRVLVDYRQAADQTNSSLSMVFSHYSISGPTSSLLANYHPR